MKIQYADNMGNNPASVDLDTGVVTLNRRIWFKLTPTQQKLILLHEEAHVRFDTIDDEIRCDRYAIEKFAGSEKNSLKKAVRALLDLIDKNYIDDQRKLSILTNALKIDAGRFSNEKAKTLLMKIKSKNTKPKAKFLATATAVVTLAATLIKVGQVTLGKRSEWSKGANSSRTPYRLSVLNAATDEVVGDIILQYEKQGNEAILAALTDYNRIYSAVYAKMKSCGVFDDDNILTRNWNNEKKFFYSNNFGWTKIVMKERTDFQIARVKEKMGSSTNVNWLKIIGFGVLGLLILKKILR